METAPFQATKQLHELEHSQHPQRLGSINSCKFTSLQSWTFVVEITIYNYPDDEDDITSLESSLRMIPSLGLNTTNTPMIY